MNVYHLMAAVAHDRGLSCSDITGRARTKALVAARAEVAFNLRFSGMSYPEIGKALNRDHTTVMHLVKIAGRDG